MRNSLADLNEYLFTEIDRLTNDDMTDEELQKEIQRATALTKVASSITESAQLQLDIVKHLEECGLGQVSSDHRLLELTGGTE